MLQSLNRSAPISDVRTSQRLSLDDITHPALLALLVLWRQAGAGQPPSRAALRPESVRGAVGRIAILQVEPGEQAVFRYRLVGSDLANSLATDMTGRTTDDFESPSIRDMLREHFEIVCRERQPACFRVHADRDYKRFDYVKLVLPVSQSGGPVDQIVMASFVEPSTAHGK